MFTKIKGLWLLVGECNTFIFFSGMFGLIFMFGVYFHVLIYGFSFLCFCCFFLLSLICTRVFKKILCDLEVVQSILILSTPSRL